ncbi:unnamed protein product [Ectocarpus sp. CCAP 1310/34]|nr:unnamed protein product [Ectocarpus sp. CCAP 1310/34]
MATSRKPVFSNTKKSTPVDDTGGMPGGGAGLHEMAPRNVVADRSGSSGARKHGQKGKDELFSFDKQNLDMFSLMAGAVAGGGGRGIRGLPGSRKARPPKPLHPASSDPAAPKGTEGATTPVAGSLSKIFSPQPAQAAIAESLSVNNATGGQEHDDDGAGENEGAVTGGPIAGRPTQPAFVVSGLAAVIKDVLAHPGGKASGESAAFVRVLAQMSADAVKSPGSAGDHNVGGGGEAAGGDGSGADGASADHGGAGVAAIDDAETFHLKTGDDAINFFAQYGENSPIKFVHLVRANKGHDFPPYDLVVVNPRECSGDYYLMSSAGLVHVCHGEPSEFTPLSEWMRQSTMFNMLQSIRFFKCYLHSKCFKLWRDNVRYKLFCQQRRKLSHRLFLAKDSFAGPYVELRRHMIDLQDIALLDLDAMKTFERAQFIEHQNARRVEAAKALESSMEKTLRKNLFLPKRAAEPTANSPTTQVGAVVQRVCAHVTGLPKAAEVSESPLDKMFGGVGDKGKSLVAMKEEAAERRRMLQRAADEAGEYYCL